MLVVVIVLCLIAYLKVNKQVNKPNPVVVVSPAPQVSSSPTPTPTPKPLTFAEMTKLYGPCVYLPTLMYHHVQDPKVAAEKKQTALTVDTDYFREQMQYLKNKGYTTATFADLVNFFNSGVGIAPKSVLITFDDGYDDFYLNALPILNQFGFKAAEFIPTGLINNPGYLSWDQISSAAGQGMVFANHTWSHKNVLVAETTLIKEITTADGQLGDHGLNNPKVFAYPYGLTSANAEKLLTKLGYQLAFTTTPGSTLCKARHFDLPRVRIGNTKLDFLQ